MSPIAANTDLTNLSRENSTTDRAADGAALLLALGSVGEELEQLKDLPLGWDGAKARPISDETIAFAYEVYASVVRPGDALPDVVPTVKGGVQFEWHTQRFDVEISVLRRAKIEIYTVDRTTGADELDTAAASAEVRTIIDGLGVRLS